MDESMNKTRETVYHTLDREVAGRYDLDYYSADDLYWEVVRPQWVRFAGVAERDLRAFTQEWLELQQ